MHTVAFPADLVSGVLQRTGKVHPFDRIDPQRTALLVVDMQNYFCAPGYMGEVPMARAIVPTINRLATGVRERGGHVVWIKGSSTGSAETWSVFNTYLMTPERLKTRLETLAEGHEGHEIYTGLEVQPEDGQIAKTRFSAFVPGSSGLDAYLRARGIDTVLVAGTTTDVCCDSTARDASMLNYKSIMVSDANATYTDAAHLASLMAFYRVFGDVQTVDEAVGFMGW
jgi:ureidoacrylate peracid hydrolase